MACIRDGEGGISQESRVVFLVWENEEQPNILCSIGYDKQYTHRIEKIYSPLNASSHSRANCATNACSCAVSGVSVVIF